MSDTKQKAKEILDYLVTALALEEPTPELRQDIEKEIAFIIETD